MLTFSKSAVLVLVLSAGLLSSSDRGVDCDMEGRSDKYETSLGDIYAPSHDSKRSRSTSQRFERMCLMEGMPGIGRVLDEDKRSMDHLVRSESCVRSVPM